MSIRNPKSEIRNPNGFTLFEALLATVVLTVTTLAVSLAISAATTQSRYSVHAQHAVELGNELMERVMALPYRDPGGNQNPGPETGAGENAPAQYDNADDYQGYSEQPSHIANLAGTLYPTDYQAFTRSVTATYGTKTFTGLGTLTGLNVTVTVTDGNHNTWTLTRFIAQPP